MAVQIFTFSKDIDNNDNKNRREADAADKERSELS